MLIIKSILNVYTILLLLMIICFVNDSSKVNAIPIPQGKVPPGAQPGRLTQFVQKAGNKIINYAKTGYAKAKTWVGNLRKPSTGGGVTGKKPPVHQGMPVPTKPAGAPTIPSAPPAP